MLFVGEPRMWKWMVPALLVPVLLFAAYWTTRLHEFFFQTFACVFSSFALVMLAAAIKQFVAYFRDIDVNAFARERRAAAITADSVRLEAAKNVHPRVFELLLGERARRWALISGTQSADGKPYRVLHAAPIVTEAFFVHFLKKSTRTSYMSKNMLSDGDKSWDPNGIVAAYEMYDAVEKMLAGEMKVVRPYGKHGKGMWLPDWEPQSVALDFGIDLDEWEYDEPKIDEQDGLIPINVNGERRL